MVKQNSRDIEKSIVKIAIFKINSAKVNEKLKMLSLFSRTRPYNYSEAKKMYENAQK